MAGGHDGPAASDDRGGRKRVANLVQEGAANIDIASGAIQQQRDHAVHHHARGGHANHYPGAHMFGVLQPVERLIENEERDRYQ